MEVSEHPLVKYRVIEDVKGADDLIKYLAEDTELHRSVAIRILPQSSAEQIERAQQWKQTLLLGTTALALLLALVFGFLLLSSPAPVVEAPVRRFILPTEDTPMWPSISPNGRHVAYFTGTQDERILWVQDLGQGQPRSIVGPTTFETTRLAWSPDSQFVSFKSARALKKVAAFGGPIVTLAEPVSAWSSTWTPDGESVIFTRPDRKLYKVPTRGGNAELWLEPENEGMHAIAPVFFSPESGSDKFLYAEDSGSVAGRLITFDRATGERETLIEGRLPLYHASGHIIYESVDSGGSSLGIWAIPFSIESMRATGNPFPIDANGRDPTVSLNGTMVYLEGPPEKQWEQLVWRDRGGSLLGTIGEPQESITYPHLSPDGRKVAVTGVENGNQDIWIHEVARPVKTNFTTDAAVDILSIWSPSGDELAFSSGREGDRTIYVKRTDGSDEPTVIAQNAEVRQWPSDWSADARILLFFRTEVGAAGGNLWHLERQENAQYKEVPLLQTPARERIPKLSPDGRLVAYRSNRTGRDEVFVCTFPECRDQQRVSENGGSQPRWSKNGKELVYVEGDSLMAVSVNRSSALSFGVPEKLFSSGGLALG